MTVKQTISFPEFSGIRCLMMPFIQGEPDSVPAKYAAYSDIVASVFLKRGDIGYLTIDESPVTAGTPHRGARAKYSRALHTEAGIVANVSGWGSPTPAGWGSPTPGVGNPVPHPVPATVPQYTPGWGNPTPAWGGRS